MYLVYKEDYVLTGHRYLRHNMQAYPVSFQDDALIYMNAM
jgi:hypothetical protein